MTSTTIQQPTPPPAPSVGQSAADYANSLPAIYAAQLENAPKFEQQNLDMTKQFAPQYKAIQDALYPELSKLDTNLTTQAQSGIDGTLSAAQQAQYRDLFRAEAGDNNGSGIAADYVSRNLIGQQEQQKNYYQNLGLTLTGRQPLYQATPGGYQQNFNAAQNYNYGTTSAFQGNAYGNYSNAYSSMYGTNANYQSSLNSLNQKYIGAGIGAVGSFIPMPH